MYIVDKIKIKKKLLTSLYKCDTLYVEDKTMNVNILYHKKKRNRKEKIAYAKSIGLEPLVTNLIMKERRIPREIRELVDKYFWSTL